MRTGLWVALGIAACLAACTVPTLSPRDIAAAHQAYDEVLGAGPGKPGPHFDATVSTPDKLAAIATIRAALPPGKPLTRTLDGFNDTRGDGRTLSMDEDCGWQGRVALVETVLVWPAGAGAGDWRLLGFHVQVATRKQLAANRFTLEGRKPGQFIFLAAAALSPMLMIAALVMVIRRNGLRRKWLWGILSFAGLFSLSMDWTTGTVRSTG